MNLTAEQIEDLLNWAVLSYEAMANDAEARAFADACCLLDLKAAPAEVATAILAHVL